MNSGSEIEAIAAVELAAESALAEIAALREKLADREERIASLQEACADREQLIDRLHEACDERLILIERLTAEIETLRSAQPVPAATNGVDWQAIAREREAALEFVSAEADRRAVLLAEVTAALRDSTEEVDQLRRSRTRTP
jgi:DNA repair exonuclease SbcCD ATPase subunit